MCASCLEEKHAGVIYGLHTGDYDFRYIGLSTSHRSRFLKHLSDAMRGGGFAVQKWIRKHGVENIQLTIIETFTIEDIDQMKEREIFHIAQSRAYSVGGNLNLTDGGEGTVGRVVSPETRALIAKSRMGNKSRLGMSHSPETRAKMSASRMGKSISPEARAKISAAKLGGRMSDDARAKMSKAHLGKPKSTNAHTRWHTNRNLIKEGCIFCEEVKTSEA